MTRADLLTSIARRTNKNTTLDTLTKNRLVDFINERQRRILSLPGAERVLFQTYTNLLLVASTAVYGLQYLEKIYRVLDLTNDRELLPMSYDEYRRVSIDGDTGTPTHYAVAGYAQTTRDLPSGSALSVVSTAAGDTQTIYIEGAETNNPINTSATMNGITPVVPAGASWLRIDRVFLSSAAVGYITLTTTSPPTTYTLCVIPPGEVQVNYLRVFVWPTPSAAATLEVDAKRKLRNLSVDGASPHLPEDWHDLVLLGALMDEYQYMADSRYEVARQEYKEREQQFRYWLATMGGQPPGTITEPPSTLGAWYPSGT